METINMFLTTRELHIWNDTPIEEVRRNLFGRQAQADMVTLYCVVPTINTKARSP